MLPMVPYDTAVSQLYALGHELHRIPAHKFDLAQIRALTEALGHPERQFASVLVAGTNGKGSTAATLASILRAAGYRTGLFTSPHLVRINERIRLDGEAIDDASFARVYQRVQEVAQQLVASGALPNLPSFFETMTAMAFCYFAEKAAQIVVLEVGMGGRLDATNIVEPVLTVITDIDLDHQKYLGNTIAEIAREKAGILRQGVTAVTLPQHPEANDVLGRAMLSVGARAVSATRNMAPVSPGSGELVKTNGGRTKFRLQTTGEEIEIDSPLIGRHQLRNLALAITAAEELATVGFPVTAAHIAHGVRTTQWPGRFHRVAGADRPEIVFDVAHNPSGAWALRSALNDVYGERPRVVVFGAMRDKAVREMAQILFSTAERVVLTTTPNNPRAASTGELSEIAAGLGAEAETREAIGDAVDRAVELAKALGKNAVVVVCGSIYIVGEAMTAVGVQP